MGKTCLSIDSAIKTRYLFKGMNIAANLLHLFKKCIKGDAMPRTKCQTIKFLKRTSKTA